MKIANQSSLTSTIILLDSSEQEVTTLSNESNTEFITESFLKVLASNKEFASPLEELEQTITLTNTSEYPITDISILDTLSAGATFKEGSVIINDVEQPDLNPTVGFALEEGIESEAETVIKYTIVIDEVPESETITETVAVTYSVNERVDLVENTNTLTIQLENNKIVIEKTSDKSAVISGETLTYTIVIKNEGNMENTNLMFTDELPSSVTFVEDSVKIDDVESPGLDPNTGFELSTLAPESQIKVSFEVTIN